MTICLLMTYLNRISRSGIKLQMLNALLTDSGKQKTNGTIDGERKNEEKVVENLAEISIS